MRKSEKKESPIGKDQKPNGGISDKKRKNQPQIDLTRFYTSDDSKQSAQERAYEYIRYQILSGTVIGGQKLKPAHIAQTLGVSRMPVREALLQLDAEGLVTARTNYSAVVTSLTPDQVEEIFEMRAALEALAACLALPNLDTMAFTHLERLVQRMDQAASESPGWIEQHGEFHDFISQQSGRPRLADEVRHLRTLVQPYLLMYINNYYSPELEGSSHQALLVAMRTGNSMLVESVIRDHALSAGRGVVRYMRQQGGADSSNGAISKGSHPR